MFLFDPAPDTSFYMNLGYAIAFIGMGIYVASLYIRSGNLKRDLEALEAMQADEEAKPTKKK